MSSEKKMAAGIRNVVRAARRNGGDRMDAVKRVRHLYRVELRDAAMMVLGEWNLQDGNDAIRSEIQAHAAAEKEKG